MFSSLDLWFVRPQMNGMIIELTTCLSFQGGTYAGNAVSCAAAVAVAEVFQEEKILENVNARYVPLPCSLCTLLIFCTTQINRALRFPQETP